MEAGSDRHDARLGWLWRIDPAGPYPNQFAVDWLIVRGNFWFWFDRGNALDVGIDWSAFRTHLTKLDSRPPGNTNRCRRSQHLLRNLVRL